MCAADVSKSRMERHRRRCSQKNLLVLSDRTLVAVMRRLDTRMRVRCLLVSKRFRRLAADPTLWRTVDMSHFPSGYVHLLLLPTFTIHIAPRVGSAVTTLNLRRACMNIPCGSAMEEYLRRSMSPSNPWSDMLRPKLHSRKPVTARETKAVARSLALVKWRRLDVEDASSLRKHHCAVSIWSLLEEGFGR